MRPILRKVIPSVKQCIIQKLLFTDFYLTDKEFLSYLQTLSPKDMIYDYTFMYVFKSFDKDTHIYRYSFVYSSKWLQSTSLKSLGVTPNSLVAFYNRLSLPLLFN